MRPTAGTSDCLVLAVGRKLTPITRKEYEAAQAAKVHCFIFQDSRVEPDDSVKAFIKAERGRAACTGRFSSPEDLARKAVAQLLGRAVYSLRQGIASQRRSSVTAMQVVEDRTTVWSQPPARRKYEEQDVAFGDSPDRPETFRTVADLVADERARAERGEYEAAFEALRDLAWALYENGRADLALEVIGDLRSCVPSGLMSPVDNAWLLNGQALALAQVGKRDEAVRIWLRMLAIGEGLDDSYMRAIAMQNLAGSAAQAGDLKGGQGYGVASMQLMRELGEMRSMLQLLNNLALIAIQEKEYELATDTLDVYERAAREAADLHLLTSAHGNRGTLLAAQGEVEAAENEFREALRFARKTGEAVTEILGLQNLGSVCANSERFGDAMRWYRKGIRLAEMFELPVQQEVLRRSLASVLHRSGRNREALAEFDRARQVAWELGETHLWAQSTLNLGVVYCLAGDATAAMEPSEVAASTFRELGDLEWELRARRNIAAARSDLGDLDAALDVLERGLGLVPKDACEKRAELLREAAEMGLEDPELLVRAINLFERALDEEAAYLDADEVAQRAATVGSFLSQAGAEEALPFFDRCVALLEGCPSAEYSMAQALNDRAVALERFDRHDEARADLLRCAELAHGADDAVLRQKAFANLSEVERQRGDVLASLDAARRALGWLVSWATTTGWRMPSRTSDSPSKKTTALTRRTLHCQELQELADVQDVPTWKARAASGRGRVAFLRADFQRASEQYASAAAIYRDADSADVVYALGGLLESLGKAGQRDGLQEAAQALIDRLVLGEDPELIINYLARTGISWLELGELEEAASLFGAAVLVGARGLGESDRKQNRRSLPQTQFAETRLEASRTIRPCRNRTSLTPCAFVLVSPIPQIMIRNTRTPGRVRKASAPTFPPDVEGPSPRR